MTHEHIGFIGGGNMARSLVGGLIASGHPADRITVSDPSADAQARLAEFGGVRLVAENADVLAVADTVVLAVKPQVMRAVIEPLAPQLARRQPLLVSIAAGLSTRALERWAGAVPLVRCMPNTPALVGAGMSVLYATAAVPASGRQRAEALLSTAGAVRWVASEALMDAVTAVSGSGPAYFFHLMECMIDAGVAQGLDPDTARDLVLQTAFGAARMAQESGSDPATLRAQVTSRGGTTAAALDVFRAGDLPGLVARAVAAAAARSAEMATELEQEPRPS